MDIGHKVTKQRGILSASLCQIVGQSILKTNKSDDNYNHSKIKVMANLLERLVRLEGGLK